MPYVAAMNREQTMVCSLEKSADPQSIAGVTEVFADSPDLSSPGFAGTAAKAEGRPCHAPEHLLKLCLYGNRMGIRSSRIPGEACRISMEVIWRMEGLKPDFRTISGFRRAAGEGSHEFSHRPAGVFTKGFLPVDGSRFHADNSRDSQFTADRLDGRIAWLSRHTDESLFCP